MLFIMFVSFIFMAFTLEKQLSFEKMDNLNNQKHIIATLTKINKDDLELALIQFNGKTAQLKSEIEKLYNIYKYSVSEKYIIGNKEEYISDLEKLSNLTDVFNQNAHKYYVPSKNVKIINLDRQILENSYYDLNNHIDSLIVKNIEYDKTKYTVFMYLSIYSFVVVFILTLLYRKRIYYIYKDIEYLTSIDNNHQPYVIYTQEADGVLLRMKRKTVVADNPAMIDQITGINNYKGLVNSYANKKDLKDSNFTSLTIIEIDNFSKTKRTFTQEMTQLILKKIAFTISLHEQPTDVIARTDYNQFTIILSRASKEQAFKDMETLRESISELKFNLPNNPTITVTGGFVIKQKNTTVDEAIRQAKEILDYAKKSGTNIIIQARDMSELKI